MKYQNIDNIKIRNDPNSNLNKMSIYVFIYTIDWILHSLKLTLDMMVWGGKFFRRWLRQNDRILEWDGELMKSICSVIPFSWGWYNGKLISHNPERGLIQNWSCWNPDLGIPVLRSRRNKLLLYTVHSLYDILSQQSKQTKVNRLLYKSKYE